MAKQAPDSRSHSRNVVAELEADGKGVPVLVRLYLQLGGNGAGFNVDHVSPPPVRLPSR